MLLGRGGRWFSRTGGRAPSRRARGRLPAALRRQRAHAHSAERVAQKAPYRLADDRVAPAVGWDDAPLAADVARLQGVGGIDLALTGFEAGEIERCQPGSA